MRERHVATIWTCSNYTDEEEEDPVALPFHHQHPYPACLSWMWCPSTWPHNVPTLSNDRYMQNNIWVCNNNAAVKHSCWSYVSKFMIYYCYVWQHWYIYNHSKFKRNSLSLAHFSAVGHSMLTYFKQVIFDSHDLSKQEHITKQQEIFW